MKKILLILFTLFSFQLFACKCEGWNKETIDKLIQKSDYIFIGTVVGNVNLNNNEIQDYSWRTNNSSSEVVIKVERIIKGKLASEYVYITQFNQGNCSRFFIKGEKYIITGFKIKKFISFTSQKKNKYLEKIKTQTETIEIPDVEFKKNKFYMNNLGGNFKGWNELAKKETLISTNICDSGSPNSPFWNLILN